MNKNTHNDETQPVMNTSNENKHNETEPAMNQPQSVSAPMSTAHVSNADSNMNNNNASMSANSNNVNQHVNPVSDNMRMKTRHVIQNDNIIGSIALVVFISAFILSTLKICSPFIALCTMIVAVLNIPYFPRRKAIAMLNMNDYTTGFDKFFMIMNIGFVCICVYIAIATKNADYAVLIAPFMMTLFIIPVSTLSSKYHYTDKYVDVMVHSIQLFKDELNNHKNQF